MKTKTLFFAVVLFTTNVSFGQIEELSRVPKTEQKKPQFADYLEKSDSPINLGEKMYNLIGMHLYNASKSPLIAIILESNNVRISPLESGETFEVTNIYSSKEILGMRMSWQKAKFISEVIPYTINGKNFKRKTTKDDLNYFNPQYELMDSKGRTIYICATYVGPFCGDMNIADASAFICIEAYNKLKEIYEGKEMASHYIDYQSTPINYANKKYFTKDDIDTTYLYHIHKIATKDGKLAASIQRHNGSMENVIINKVGKSDLHMFHKEDSLSYLNITLEDGYSATLYFRNELDSLIAKWEQQSFQEEREKLAKDEKRKQEFIEKYGQKYAQDIFDGKASVGMSQEMCREALGSPDEVSKSSNSNGSVEVWVYSMYHKHYPSLFPIIVVTFANDKVTSVNEYTDSNYIFE